ncbi:MAG: exostosin domain-containing protein [Methylococcaceae bacterium]
MIDNPSLKRMCSLNVNCNLAWEKSPNLVAFPHGWQFPAKTEAWVYEQCLRCVVASPFYELVCFPWATLVDLQRKGIDDKTLVFTRALSFAPPCRSLIRATVCQHIYANDLLPWFNTLKITDVFWSHATVNTTTDFDGIRVHPFPLYPVRCEVDGSVVEQVGKSLHTRRFIYSFIGTYSEGLYLTPVRQWIFDLPKSSDGFIEYRGEWHFEKVVYREQIIGQSVSVMDRQRTEQYEKDYTDVMRESVFCLCPSGAGPNSIRLWESLGFGCIPVLLADTLRLPGPADEWERAIVRLPETPQAVAGLPTVLRDIAANPERLSAMQAAGRVLWKRYGENGPLSILGDLARRDWMLRQTKIK